MNSTPEDLLIQREYYARTAGAYDDMHLGDAEHEFATRIMLAAMDHLQVRSVLDIGSGTGRALRHIKQARPETRVLGIEPVAELRQIGHRNGITAEELVDGDATRLPFRDGEFDLVCEFGVLHHIRNPQDAVREMLRVSRKAILISDSNNFGQGGFASRTFKQLLDACGLWRLVDLVKTRGKGYTISEGDGLAYSYSVYNNYRQIRAQCRSVHVMNTTPGGINPYRSASHVVLLGIRD
jgi:ubiquinone/menaquinone biosynthesis C-methylase UbiE